MSDSPPVLPRPRVGFWQRFRDRRAERRQERWHQKQVKAEIKAKQEEVAERQRAEREELLRTKTRLTRIAPNSGYCREHGTRDEFRAFAQALGSVHTLRVRWWGPSPRYDAIWRLGDVLRNRVRLASETDAISMTSANYLTQVWLEELLTRRLAATRLGWSHSLFGLIAVVAGALIASLQGLSLGGAASEALGWVVFGLGLLVTLAASVSGFFRLAERRAATIELSSELERMGWEFVTCAGPYGELLERERREQEAQHGAPVVDVAWPYLIGDRLGRWHARCFDLFLRGTASLLKADTTDVVGGVRKTVVLEKEPGGTE